MSKRISMIRWGISFFIGIAACLLSSCYNRPNEKYILFSTDFKVKV